MDLMDIFRESLGLVQNYDSKISLLSPQFLYAVTMKSLKLYKWCFRGMS